MRDYKVTVKVQNGYLMQKMDECGIKNVRQLANLAGVCPSTVGRIANLKAPLFTKEGHVSKPVARLCEFLGCDAEDIYPMRHIHHPLHKNLASKYVSHENLNRFIAESESDPLLLIEDDDLKENAVDVLGDALSTLDSREKSIVELYYGIGNSRTFNFAQIAEKLGVSIARVVQIHNRAIRRLRHPSRSDKIKEELCLSV